MTLPVTAPVSEWRADMDACPAGRKCLLLTWHGIAVIGHLSDPAEYAAWSPLPQMPDAVKRRVSNHLLAV